MGQHRSEPPETVARVFITGELARRIEKKPDFLREKLAIQDLALLMAHKPHEILPRLVQLAMEVCKADSAGISLYEAATHEFRWVNLAGELKHFNGATTPRDFSPCGVCLDQGSPVLLENPERVYTWIADANIVAPEVLLVPLFVDGGNALGTLWVVGKGQKFDAGHSRVLSELASFAGVALRMIKTEESLKTALEEQATLAKEMSHRVKNLFAITDGMVRMTARSSDTKEEMATNLSGRLHALSTANGLIRRTFNAIGIHTEASNLSEVIAAILKPYSREPKLSGPLVPLGDRPTNTIALIFHELATNAAKYGALKTDGSVAVSWWLSEDDLHIAWIESGGPSIESVPDKKGFGSSLVENTVVRHGGKILHSWKPGGLEVEMCIPLKAL